MFGCENELLLLTDLLRGLYIVGFGYFSGGLICKGLFGY